LRRQLLAIEGWIHDYLNGAGRNVPMARGLRRRRRWWIGPVAVPVVELSRIVGPEPGMPYPRAPEDWEPRLAGIERSLRRGWDVPPVIVDACHTDALLVADGNHRFEAQRQMGRDAVWSLLFFDEEETWRSFERPWAVDASRHVGTAGEPVVTGVGARLGPRASERRTHLQRSTGAD
jgi:hypothetical protein